MVLTAGGRPDDSEQVPVRALRRTRINGQVVEIGDTVTVTAREARAFTRRKLVEPAPTVATRDEGKSKGKASE